MGVPALFRWLSKKYPKIILPVVEEEETKMQDDHDNEIVIPTNMASPNPNGMEFDNLYLDMNGIVHPCTHPEGKPAPETEEEMMTEIFKYTERVVNMVRPRKLLFMAIDGVAPRAKMNQQRSRRFRSAQEAKEKEEAHRENIAIWEAMGKKVSEEEKVKEAWDSNAITPGTPFMDLLAQSLRYWVVQKLNTDAGWKQMQVIISDASVPGEGEHKIMDYIRRQRTNPGHDPNTRHVIYGLDADLIMLALATHEPHFRVLREDVFFQDTSPTACRTCGQEGHYSAQCTGVKAEVKKTPPEKKPYIFLDVTILREYLEVELDVSHSSFPFNLEQAIDDWVLLIFFVGNDFLPHLPSLEIREGAIDTLLKIWKQELPRMGGYLTNHGTIEMSRAQIILEGLAKREDDIFRRRREAEERQDQNAKRRKIEMETVKGPSASLRLTEGPTPPTSGLNPVHPSLPQRPNFNFAANADSIGLGAQRTQASVQNVPTATQALAGSNRDVVANRKAIRMANMSAAEVLKAELSGSGPVKPIASLPPKPVGTLPVVPQASRDFSMGFADSEEIPGLGGMLHEPQVSLTNTRPQDDILPEAEALLPPHGEDINADGDVDSEIIPDGDSEAVEEILVGVKRKAPEEETEVNSFEEDEADGNTTGANLALKVRPDGTAEQEDTVKLWEPGYRERYYKQKFGVELSDIEFRKSLTKSYVEGLSWVLHYYYQGTPSWQWYYPHHFAPFAADFLDVDGMDITFELGTPFKPFEQLMGVFPAASRKHIPDVFHTLMTDEDSPIIDFYPSSFEIDMNGKKMAWQGVALLPFIDPKRLLDAMNPRYPGLTEEEVIRNQWGDNVVFAADEHPVYPFYEQLYGKRKSQEPSIINPKVSKGISGSVLPNPNCLPGSTYYCPLKTQGLPDIKNDRSLSVLYYFPKQLTPHRSVMLPGVKYGTRTLLPEDLEITRNGGRGRGRGGWGDRGGGRGRGNNGPNRNGDPFHSRPNTYGSGPANGTRGYGGGGRGGSYQNSYPPRQNQNQPYSQSYSQQSYGSGYGGGRPSGNSYGGGNQYDGYGSSGGPQRGGYHGGEANGNYGGYGGYGGSSGGYNGGDNYGGYGGGGQPNWNTNDTQYGGYGSGGGYGGYGGYGNSGRGALPSRGRGRGW